LTGLGASVFDPYRGFVYVCIGTVTGASMAFWMGRTLRARAKITSHFRGRQFCESIFARTLREIERNEFAATCISLRLVYFPFTPTNFRMGLTNVRFWDYFAGTGLGILVVTFPFNFFMGTLPDVWASGDWGQLFFSKVVFFMAVFVFSFLMKS
jgi:uncharacterized membrane protein YdjX (TVP38/TMEM64 family)